MHFVIFADTITKERLITLDIPNIKDNIIELEPDGEISPDVIMGARELLGDSIVNIRCYYDTAMPPSNLIISDTFRLIALDQIIEKDDLVAAFRRMEIGIQDNSIDEQGYRAFQMAQALARAV
jgi:hypothetical protein